MGLVVALLILAGLGLLLYVAWRRGRLASTFIAVTIGSALLWGLAFAAVWTDYRDADGWVGCWPACTAFQDAVRVTFVLGPPAFVALGLFAAALAGLTRLRERGSRRPG